MWYEIIKPLLFSLEPETAHEVATKFMKTVHIFPFKEFGKRIFSYHSKRLESKVWNIPFSNPIGLAAGFDKTGELYPIFSVMGFGFIECGTFTPKPQSGNPKPRLFRFPEYKAIINRMGFNNPGMYVAKKSFQNQKRIIPRGINIGKNKSTPNEKAIEDYLECFKILYPYADYIVMNISSPNTPDLRKLQESEQILELISILKQEKFEKPIPILIKLAPDLTEGQFYKILEKYVLAGVDGIVLTNTTISRPDGIPEEKGGLSGLPLKEISTHWIRKAYRFLGGQIPIIGVGGVFSGKDAIEKFMAGASLVQIYTGYIYEGPFLPKTILQYIDEFLEKENITLKDIIGYNVK